MSGSLVEPALKETLAKGLETSQALERECSSVTTRPHTRGKFLFIGNEKFWVRGVSYGAFRPDPDGQQYSDKELLDRDFSQMKALGINTVRIPHTMPPTHLLDIAQKHGLKVMVGLSAEQYVGYLIDKEKAHDIEREVRDKVRPCAGHPALLCYALGNEIQAPVLRWLGRHRVERYLKKLYHAVKDEDPTGLVTYVNYPTTEYLDLSFLDLASFNVYLEQPDIFRSYLARLQNVAGEKPLLMTEIGLDSLRNGEKAQAESLDWQIRTAFEAGCVGTIIFSWTDEWFRADAEVDDWAFGITDKSRRPKAAADVVQKAFDDVPFVTGQSWPRISVVICTYNGADTIRDTLDGCVSLTYPNFEVIVVCDGCTDNTEEIAQSYDVRVISTKNQGLSAARNEGMQAAEGEIVAYIDDDAYPDPHWLNYLAKTFMRSDYVGVGGPNLLPPSDGDIAQCVYNAPGGPTHVLLTDDVAEHIPGCNMAFRKDRLEAVGGFDPRFRTAGDDVDLCWRLQDNGGKIGFSPTAMVWHHRRNSVSAYWKQQKGYGKAEALLEEKWPDRYNEFGQATWFGRIYGAGARLPLLFRQPVYHGIWGSAPFQSLYGPAPYTFATMLLMPEWYLLIGLLIVLSLLGIAWTPLLVAAPLLLISVVLLIAQACRSAARAPFMQEQMSLKRHWRMFALTAGLHLVQPLARLMGHLIYRPARLGKSLTLASFLPFPRKFALWTESWQPPESYLEEIDTTLRQKKLRVSHGDAFDRWDLTLAGGLFGGARLLMAVEDHGGGAQYVRARVWPRCSASGVITVSVLAVISALAALDQAWIAAAVLGGAAVVVGVRMSLEFAGATSALFRATKSLFEDLKGENSCTEDSKRED
jgi:GT2 family glycosyltransferase